MLWLLGPGLRFHLLVLRLDRDCPLLSNVHDYILIIEQCQVCHQNHHNQKDKSLWQLMPGLLIVEVGKATQAGRTDDDADDSDDHCSDDEAWWTSGPLDPPPST